MTQFLPFPLFITLRVSNQQKVLFPRHLHIEGKSMLWEIQSGLVPKS